jgi:hypothetical protein
MSDASELTDEQQQWAQQWAERDYADLKQRAVHLAEHRHDIGWLWKVVEHSRGMSSMATEGGDLGSVGGSVSDAVAAVQQVFGHAVAGDTEPMFRTVFSEYLAIHEGAPPASE